MENVAGCALGNRVWFDNGKSALQCLHSCLISPKTSILTDRAAIANCLQLTR
jgi:hypothetical protein